MKILLFVEPTARGDWAATLARDLVASLGGKLILLTTAELAAREPGLLDRVAARFADVSGLEAEKRVREGRPRVAIVEETRESMPAITIVPPAGRKWLARMVKGSRVKSVVHNAPSTVMVARKPVAAHIRKILVTLSGGPMTETTTLGALEVAKALGAELTLLHVASNVPIPTRSASSGGGEEDLLAPAEKLLRGAGVAVQRRTREGMVVPEIIAECKEGAYDLLILGQHLVDPDAGGALAENLAEDLAMECPIPTLVIRARKRGKKG
jgi:nucleotide-binding universal stress UspA family protein